MSVKCSLIHRGKELLIKDYDLGNNLEFNLNIIHKI
jgi:hypothetical protein